MTLKVVEPIDITEAVLTASDIPEPDASVGEVEWEVDGRKAKFALQPLVLDTIKPYGSAALFGAATSEDRATFLCVDSLTPNTGALPDSFYVISRDKQGNIGGYAWNNYFTNSELNSIFRVSDEVLGYVGIASDNFTDFDVGNFYYIESVAGDVFPLNNSRYLFLASGSEISGRNKSLCSGVYLDEFVCALDDSSSTYQSTFYLARSGFGPGFSRKNLVLKFPDSSYQNICKIFELSGKPAFAFSGYGGIKVYTYSSDLQFDTPPTLEYEIKFDSSVAPFTANAYITESTTDYAVDTELFYTLNLPSGQGTVYDGYIPGDTAVLTDEHKKYQCLRATTENPLVGATEGATATWIEVGTTNKWAMFDGLQNTKTSNQTDFTITLNPESFVNTLAIFGFKGVSSVRIEVDNSLDVNIYDKTYSMNDFSSIYDHYTYAFYQISSLDKFIATDLPPLPNTTIRLTFSGSDMTIGELVTGFAIDIGQLVAENTKSDRFRYREQEYNEFGYPTGQPPIVVELNTYDVLVPKLNNQAIQKLLDTITGENTLWFGDIGGGQSLVTYGFFERSPIPYSMPNHINYQITVRASL